MFPTKVTGDIKVLHEIFHFLMEMSTDELMIIKEGRTVPRKGHIAKRDVLADPIYNNKVVTKLSTTLC